MLKQMVQSKIRNTLLSNNNIRLHLQNILALLSNFDFFHSECFLEIIFFSKFHIGHRLALLVLERAIKKNHTWVLNLSSHTGVAHIFVEHYTV